MNSTATTLLLVLTCLLVGGFAFSCTGDDDDRPQVSPDDDDDAVTADDDDDDDNDDVSDDDDDNAIACDLLVVEPSRIVIEAGQSIAFEAFCADGESEPVRVDAGWDALVEAGTIDPQGHFTAGDRIGVFQKAVSAKFQVADAFAEVTVTTSRSDFIFGFSHAVQPESIYVWSQASYEQKLDRMIGDFEMVGAAWYRAYIIWKDVDPMLEEPELSLDEVNDDKVQAYAFEDVDKNWAKYDLLMDKLDAAGIKLFLVIAAGYTWELPRMSDGTKATVPALPETIGYDNYIAQACLHARAAVRRYGQTVGVWVTEAELNMAGPTVLWGWRDGVAWWDADFLTELLATLSSCVHQEDPAAQVTMNFHTDVAWKNRVRDWAPYLDIISLDAFPNYFISDPVRGHVVGRRVRETLLLGTGKPVVVQETSYPTGVSYFHFTEEKQAQFIQEGVRSVYDAGGSGYFHFKLSAAEELGGGPWYHEAESKYGLVRTDDTYKPGFEAYRDVIDELRTTP